MALFGWSKVGDKNQGRCQILTKPRPSKADHFRGYCWASWIVTRDRGLTSYSLDYREQAGFLGWSLQVTHWFPGLVAVDRRSEFNFHIWTSPWPFVYSVCQVQNMTRENSRNPAGINMSDQKVIK